MNSLTDLHKTLERYAGWLDRERPSALVRADVHALGAALDARTDDLSPLLQALETNIARLPSGELRKLLRTAAAQMRRALAKPE